MQYDTSTWGAVWQRVMAGPENMDAPAEFYISAAKNQTANTAEIPGKTKGDTPSLINGADTAQLRAFMDGEAADAALYRRLAPRCSGEAARRLGAMAAEARRSCTRLGDRYAMLTGVRYRADVPCPDIYSAPEALRAQYFTEAERARAYLDAGKETGNPDLSALYERLAGAHTARAEGVSRLARRLCAR